MCNSTFIKSILLFGFTTYMSAQTEYTAVHFADGKPYVVHNGGLLEKAKKNTMKNVLTFDQKASASVVNGNELWVGSKKGVAIYNLENYALLCTKFKDTAISGLAVDARGKIWVATTFKGVLAQNDKNVFETKLNVMTNYCVTATPDHRVYVGTNLGLYQIPLGDEKNTLRYAEEAHSGHGLPDNLVENLYADASSNLWIMMPDNISFKKSDNSFGEIPSFAFVGNKDNRIFKILEVKGGNYLFVTSNGVVLLPSASLKAEHGHGDEVFSGHDTNAILLDAKVIATPDALKNDAVLYAEKNNGRIYFYTKNGMWDMREKDIAKFLKKKASESAKAKSAVATNK